MLMGLRWLSGFQDSGDKFAQRIVFEKMVLL